MHPDSRSTYAMHLLCIPFLSAFLLLSLSCSKSTDPDTSKPPDTGPVGILLSAADSDSALSGTSNHGPFAVPADEWDGDFVTTRLEAVINPNVTVGAVNTALNVIGAKISCMRAGLMFTELVVPALSSVNQASTACSTLVTSNAFLSAYPCFDPINSNNVSVIPDFPANIRITPLEEAKFPAAWNLRERAAGLHSPVTVMVADKFAKTTVHAEIPSQTFIAGIGVSDSLMDAMGKIPGNHGYAVAGAIGAHFDNIGSTGAFADTSNLLRLPCVRISGFGSWVATITEVFMRLPVSGRFILNTSWGYGQDFTAIRKRWRIENALYWRSLIAHRQNDFLHVQSSGNLGFYSPVQTNADYNSPFTLAARFDTPFQMLQGTAVTPADSMALTTLFSQLVALDAATGTKLQNVITVGSSDWNGGLSTFSNGPPDVRMIGENVTLPCIMGDAICGPGADVAWEGSWEGTSFATPQVAALAAWLWALSPTLTVDETKSIIMNSYYNNKWVDAYKAVLSLDHSIANAGTRLSLLDIADATGQKGSDMKFDEKDLQMFLDSILYYEADRGSKAPPWPRDHSPFDLNGDGYTGDTMLTPSTAPFDLDINTPPAYGQLQFKTCIDTSLNENAITDRDILYYYAFTSVYSGDKAKRDELFECPDTAITGYYLSLAPSEWQIQYASTRDLEISVDATTGQGSIPIEGASIQISVSGAKLSANSGLTDAQGLLTVYFDPDCTFDMVTFEVVATKGGEFLLTETLEIPITTYAGWVGQWDEVGSPSPGECNGNPNYPVSSLLQIGWAIDHLEGIITGFATGDLLAMNSVTRTQIVAETWESSIKTGEVVITRVPGGKPCEISAIWTRQGGCTVSYNYPAFVKRLCTSLP